MWGWKWTKLQVGISKLKQQKITVQNTSFWRFPYSTKIVHKLSMAWSPVARLESENFLWCDPFHQLSLKSASGAFLAQF